MPSLRPNYLDLTVAFEVLNPTVPSSHHQSLAPKYLDLTVEPEVFDPAATSRLLPSSQWYLKGLILRWPQVLPPTLFRSVPISLPNTRNLTAVTTRTLSPGFLIELICTDPRGNTFRIIAAWRAF
ncbi:hypothetical protein ACTXT7_000807 [Hymenolepis weldensis]